MPITDKKTSVEADDNNSNDSDSCDVAITQLPDNSKWFKAIKKYTINPVLNLIYGLAFDEINQLAFMFSICILIFFIIEYKETQLLERVSKPIFPSDSVVLDFHDGNFQSAMNHSYLNRMTLVMFYAPWDGDSLSLRNEILIVADYFGDMVSFKAVNCWQPNSYCKRKFESKFVWPTLVVYRSDTIYPLMYGGLHRASHIIRFIDFVMNPIVPIFNRSDLNDLLANYENVAICFISLDDEDQYDEVLGMALKIVSLFPIGQFRIAVNTQYKTNSFGVKKFPSLYLYTWNSTKIYSSGNWTSVNLFDWLNRNFDWITSWIQPNGEKNAKLVPLFNTKPVVVLLTPYNPLVESMDYYNVFRQINLEIANHNKFTNSFIKAIRSGRVKNREKSIFHNQLCNNYKPEIVSVRNSLKKPVVLLKTGNDYLNSYKRKICKKLFLSKSLGNLEPFSEIHSENKSHTINRKINLEISMIAFDSILYEDFATVLGIDLKNRPDRTAVVILDKKMENHYVMNSAFNEQNLYSFLQNYSLGLLDRSIFHRNFTSPKYTNQNCDTIMNQTNKVCVRELTTYNFLPTILISNKAFLVYFYSLQCGLCLRYSLMMLNLVHVFRDVPNLNFVRIDGDRNVLPWQYTMSKFPTFLFIPELTKGDSKVFPYNVPVNEAKLANFLLDCDLNAEMRLQLNLKACESRKLKKVVCTLSNFYRTIVTLVKDIKKIKSLSSALKSVRILRQLVFNNVVLDDTTMKKIDVAVNQLMQEILKPNTE